MNMITKSPLLTIEDWLALPDDGIERDLIRGQLREYAMTRRGRRHSRAEAALTISLGIWLEAQPLPHGEILCGEAAFKLGDAPDTGVGIDIAYISAEMSARNAVDVFVLQGPPILAVEILSPSDTVDNVADKVELYLETGVNVIWIVNPRFQAVTVHESGKEPVMYNRAQDLVGDPHLPGFRVPVAKLFS